MLTDSSQTASDWLSVAVSQTTKHPQTAFSHSHHTDFREEHRLQQICLLLVVRKGTEGHKID